jgi:hypothetical protein
MAYGRNTSRRRSAARTNSYRRPSSGRRPGGRTVRRTGGRSRVSNRPQVVKIQLQVAAPPISGTGLPADTVAEVKAQKAKF